MGQLKKLKNEETQLVADINKKIESSDQKYPILKESENYVVICDSEESSCTSSTVLETISEQYCSEHESTQDSENKNGLQEKQSSVEAFIQSEKSVSIQTRCKLETDSELTSNQPTKIILVSRNRPFANLWKNTFSQIQKQSQADFYWLTWKQKWFNKNG